MIETVTSESFRDRVLQSDVPVVVDFYADWCQPCRQVTPVLNNLAQQHEGTVRFTKVNIDEEPELAQAYRVTSIPAILRFDSGAPTAWSLGPKPAHLLAKELKLPKVRTAARASDDPSEESRPGFVRAVRSWWGSQ